jgi:triacylglycerol lipase
MLHTLGHWLRDYVHMARLHAYRIVYRKPPEHYLGHIVAGKVPVVIIPGIYEKWQCMKPIADALSLEGHPVYVLPRLGDMLRAIPESAALVRELIDERHLTNSAIVAHSKGGLVGKYLLAFHNADGAVRRMIAIATPFGGSRIARLIPGAHYRELDPESPILQKLGVAGRVNDRITSIFGVFDNHVWPTESCHLEGAENIQVPVHGHHKILFDRHVREIVMRKVAIVSKSP